MTLDDRADARAAAESLAREFTILESGLLGHSEGASLAVIAARQGPPVAGVISVSGLGRPLSVVVREQLARSSTSAHAGPLRHRHGAVFARRAAEGRPPQLVPLFVPINCHFMKSLTAFDPPAAIRAVSQPLLSYKEAVTSMSLSRTRRDD